MKVVKHHVNDKMTQKAMEVFDKVIGSVYFNWPLKSLEIYVTESPAGDLWIEGDVAKLFIDKNHHFVREMDERGIESMVLTSLHSLILRMNGFETSDLRQSLQKDEKLFKALLLLEDFVASRKAARKFPDAIFYRNADKINRMAPSSFLDELEIWLSSMSFYKIDQWNMNYLIKLGEAKIGKKMDPEFMKKFMPFLDSPQTSLDQEDLEQMIDVLKSHISQ